MNSVSVFPVGTVNFGEVPRRRPLALALEAIEEAAQRGFSLAFRIACDGEDPEWQRKLADPCSDGLEAALSLCRAIMTGDRDQQLSRDQLSDLTVLHALLERASSFAQEFRGEFD